jgi:hypothetical protein
MVKCVTYVEVLTYAEVGIKVFSKKGKITRLLI